MTTARRRAAQGSVAALLLVGCGSVSAEDLAVTVTADGRSVVVEPWAFCWTAHAGGGCADGSPPEHPPSVGSPATVVLTLPRPGWDAQATFVPAGEPCGRAQVVDLGRTDDAPLTLAPESPTPTT